MGRCAFSQKQEPSDNLSFRSSSQEQEPFSPICSPEYIVQEHWHGAGQQQAVDRL